MLDTTEINSPATIIFFKKYLEFGVQIVVHLQIFDSPRVAGQVDPSPNKALNDRRACQAMILPFHIHAPYISFSIFFFMISFLFLKCEVHHDSQPKIEYMRLVFGLAVHLYSFYQNMGFLC